MPSSGHPGIWLGGASRTASVRQIQRARIILLAAKAQYGIGDALFNDRRLEEAVQAYTRVLERYPESLFVADAAAGIQYALIGLDDQDGADALIDAF